MLDRLLKDRWGYLIRRLFAFGFDWYLCAVLCNVLSYGVEALIKPANDMQTMGVLVLSAILGSLFYFVIVPTFVWPGQSVMMKAMQVKCVRIDGSELTLANVAFRFIVGCLLVEGSFYFASTIIQTVLIVLVFPNPQSVDSIAGTIFMVIGVSSLLFAFFDVPRTRMFHDLLGKTNVIDIRKIS